MPGRHLLALVFVSTVLLAGNMTMLSVTAPVISEDLGAGPAATTWMVLGYLLVTATTTVAMGQLCDLWDARRLFGIGLAGFMLTSVLLVISGQVWTFVAVRAVQGLFGAIIIATAAALVVSVFYGPRLTWAMGIYLGGYAASQVVAPPVAGLVADTVGWRWMFVGSAAVSVAACVAAPGILRRLPAAPRRKGRIDVLGNLVLVVGVGSLLLGVTAAQQSGWTSPHVVLLLVVGLVSGPAFVAIESRVASPVVDVALLRDRDFALPVLAGGLVAVPRVVPTVVLAVVLQGRYGMSATRASGVVLALAAGVLVGSLVAGRLTRAHGVERVCRDAVVLTVVGVAGLATVLLLGEVVGIAGLAMTTCLAVTGVASGVYSAANAAQILSSAATDQSGSVNAVRTTAQSLSIAVGTATLLTLLGGGLEGADARALFSGEPGALDAAALAAVDRNILLTLGALVATSVLAGVITLWRPRREGAVSD